MPEFTSPWFFLLLIPLTIITIVALRRRPAAILFSDTQSVKESGGKVAFSWLRACPDLLFFVAGLMIVIALAGPRKGIGLVKERTEGIDIMLVLDVSGSMQTIDIPEKYKTGPEIQRAYDKGDLKNRMEVAKRELEHFVKNRPSDRIGLISFAGLPFTVCPPTLDHDYLTGHLQLLKAGMFDRTAGGTGMASPIAIATNSLKASDSKRRVIVLFTDGANNIEDTITPEQAAELAANYNITIYTVGIGSDRAIVIDSFFGARSVKDEFDEPLLQAIAEKTNGIYMKAADEDRFRDTMEKINKLEKVTIIQPRFTTYKLLFSGFLLAAIILVALAFILEHTVCLRIP